MLCSHEVGFHIAYIIGYMKVIPTLTKSFYVSSDSKLLSIVILSNVCLQVYKAGGGVFHADIGLLQYGFEHYI